MISVIVPVYNVEPYLRKCLDSIVNQMYRDLEILVIDDGSTDGSGRICDEYAERDERIKVFRTENRGLSCARNRGLDEAHGEWIGFVDSDDWIEESAIQKFFDTAVTTGADIVACRFYQEYVDETVESSGAKEPFIAEGDRILGSMLVERKMTEDVWNKFYKACLFNHIRYPEGRIFEDYATTYKLLQEANRLAYIPDCLIHYRNRKNSLSNIHSMKSLVDYWTVYRDRFDKLGQISENYYRVTLSDTIRAVGRMWRWYGGCTEEEKREAKRYLDEMQEFVEEHRHEILNGEYSKHAELTCRYARSQNSVLFRLLYHMNKVYRNKHRHKFFA